MRNILLILFIPALFSCNNSKNKEKEKQQEEELLRIAAERKIINGLTEVMTQFTRKNDILSSLLSNDKTSSPAQKDSLAALIVSLPAFSMSDTSNEKGIRDNIDVIAERQKKINALLVSWNKNDKSAENLFLQLQGMESRIKVATQDYNSSVEAFNTSFPDKKKDIYIPIEKGADTPVKFD